LGFGFVSDFVLCASDLNVTEDFMSPEDLDERNLHQDYQRKRVRIPPPKSVRDVLSQLLAKRGYAQVQTAATCEAAWREAVGQTLAAHTRAGAVRRGVLEVLVRNSATNQELAFQKTKIVKMLSQLIPEQRIKDLRFRVGSLD
jgi:predicted nucleic acid-binding Zn ribbon protein